MISPQQFEFQKGKNTTDDISFLIKSIYNALDNKNHTLSVFIDLIKAFDTINYEILCSELSNFGIRGISNSWLESFFINRTQRLKIISSFSE